MILYCTVFLSVISVSLSRSCNLEIKLKQVLYNEGFHRNLTYLVLFQEDGAEKEVYSGCHVSIEQTLPAGVFANPDELSDLKRVGKVHALLNNPVNVELPFEQARSISALSFGTVTGEQAELWLPVHARYHGAAAGGGEATVALPAPRLYVRCGPGRGCAGAGLTTTTFVCGDDTRELCRWTQVPYRLLTPTPKWKIPIGNTNDYYVVASGTAMAVIFGTLYILKAIHDYKTSKKKSA